MPGNAVDRFKIATRIAQEIKVSLKKIFFNIFKNSRLELMIRKLVIKHFYIQMFLKADVFFLHYLSDYQKRRLWLMK